LPLFEVNPAYDPINFAPRVKIPLLIINGKYDHLFPYETSQLPLLEHLGTPPADLKHVVLETGHSPYGFRNEIIRETLDWLDRYLGPVE
jgi:dipeptidyl aminopeptidase/acylaminoacyl peptidase